MECYEDECIKKCAYINNKNRTDRLKNKKQKMNKVKLSPKAGLSLGSETINKRLGELDRSPKRPVKQAVSATKYTNLREESCLHANSYQHTDDEGIFK